nr:HAMP domain-containing sensor histidine kinase [Micromonospora sp. DSM 115978]
MRVRWRWRHWTLRARLGLALALLAGVVLVVANAAGLLLLRSYLTDKVDDQLLSMSRRFERSLPPPGPFPGPVPQPGGGGPAGADSLVYLYDADGRLAGIERPANGAATPSPPSFDELAGRVERGRPYTVEAVDGQGSWRMLAVRRDDGGTALLGLPLTEVDETADSLLAIDIAVMAVVLTLLGLLTAWVVRLGLRPLTSMGVIAAEITAGDLSRRVTDADPHTEPGRLGVALNTMLGRIESEIAARTVSEQRLRQFLADASHELRTPLTSIRGFAELYRRGGAPPGPLLDETMGRIENEAARMGLLVDDLLLLARLDLQRPLRRDPVDLLAIAADTIRDAHARAPDRTIRLASLGDDFEPVTVLGDDYRLRQVATNLVANALQHTPPEAEITVRVGKLAPAEAGAVAPDWPADARAGVLEVADGGPGIPAEHADRVFERLYRVDPSRTRGHGGGSGLGLSIVAAIVTRHGGQVRLISAPRQGAVFRVLLPVRGPES